MKYYQSIDAFSFFSIVMILNDNIELLKEIFIYSKLDHHWVCLRLFNNFNIVELPMKIRCNNYESVKNIDVIDYIENWVPILYKAVNSLWDEQTKSNLKQKTELD